MPRLLIFDEDPRFSAMLDLTLRSLGFRTDLVDTHSDAIAALNKELYDLVVLDVHQPASRDRDGFEVLEQVVQLQPETPTVVVSEDGDPSIERRAWRHGANSFHRKPLDPMLFLHDVIQLCMLSMGSVAPVAQPFTRSASYQGDAQTA